VYQCGLWRRLLRSYLVPHANTTNLQLLNPVGVWVQPSNMRWGAMIWDDNLYRRDPHHHYGERQVSIHFPKHLVTSDGVSASRTFYDTKPDWFATHVPKLAVPADLEGEHILVATHSASNYSLIPEPADTFSEWVLQLPPAEYRLLSDISFEECDAEEILVQYLQIDCTLYIGTDGGKRHHSGSFSWIIFSPGEEKLVMNAGPVDGWHKCQNSLRSEAAALTSVTLYLDELATFFSLDIQCQFQLFVDSNSAISNVSQLRDLIPRRRFANNADIFSTMSAAHPVIKQFRFQHVKSHQDDQTDFEKLPFPAQVNVLCDDMATQQLIRQKSQEDQRTLSCPLTPRHLQVELAYRGQIISSHYVHRLREEICLARHRSFLQTKYKWDAATWDSIAWELFALCANKTRLSRHASFRSKLVHNWLHLGDQRSKYGASDVSLTRHCPYCQLPEDFRHFLTCSAPRALKVRYDATAALRKALDGSPGATAMFNALKQWTLNPDDPVTLTPHPRNYPGTVECALRSQLAIGWPQFFRGFISVEWGNIVTRLDNTSMDDRRSRATRSLATVIKSVQLYSHALWTGRNSVLHEHSESSLAIVHASLNHSISQLYSLQSSFSAILQSYFRLPLEDRLRQSPRQRQRWLRLVRIATSPATSAGQNQQLISMYFPHSGNHLIEHPSSSLECPETQLVEPRATIQTSIQSHFPSLVAVSATAIPTIQIDCGSLNSLPD
jgi:hypothetical protein